MALPQKVQDALDWKIEDYQPLLDALMSRDLTADTVEGWLKDWSELDKLVEEVYQRLYVATTVDTTDEAATQRFEAFVEHIIPPLQTANDKLNRKLADSGLEPKGFEIPLRNIRTDIELFRAENLPLQTEESKLGLEYDKIIAAQTVEWDGKEITLMQLQPLYLEADRAVRERAWRVGMERRLQDRDALNELWVKLLNIRKQMAANAGFDNYLDYRWKQMHRFDYTPADSTTFQDAIEKVVVPAAARIYKRKQQRLNLDSLRPWDTEVDPNGAPLKPYQTAQEFEDKAESIFKCVDPQLGDYFRVMRDEGLLDLDNRKGKAPGGYCTSFAVARRPYIFMNGVGIHDDVQTLLHEGGHAFHVFESAVLPYHHQQNVPMEFAEVASMSMELLGAPYLPASQGGYYGETDAARARAEHLEGLTRFWPYMAVVDAFQHWVYTNIDDAMYPANCDTKWAELWDRFMTGIDYDGLDEIKATGWHRKLHIFQIPFYYIEYGLAQLGAVQVWANSLKNQTQAVQDYRKALAMGGTGTLPQLFGAAGAKFGFDTDILTTATTLVEETLAELDNA
jgi:oligoendopeptidase F